MSLLSSPSLISFIGRAIEEILRHYRDLVPLAMTSLIQLLADLHRDGVTLSRTDTHPLITARLSSPTSNDDYVQYSQRLSRTSQLLEVLLRPFANEFTAAGGIDAIVKLAALRNSSAILCGYVASPSDTILSNGSGVTVSHTSGGVTTSSNNNNGMAMNPLDADNDDRDMMDGDDDDDRDTPLSSPSQSADSSRTSGAAAASGGAALSSSSSSAIGLRVGGSTAFVSSLTALSNRECLPNIMAAVMTQLSSQLAAVVDTPRFIAFDFLSYHLVASSSPVPLSSDSKDEAIVCDNSLKKASSSSKEKETKSKDESKSNHGSGNDDRVAVLHRDLCTLSSVEWCINLLIKMLPRHGTYVTLLLLLLL
jgi:hypothetical protein